jgi:hypothetical protein
VAEEAIPDVWQARMMASKSPAAPTPEARMRPDESVVPAKITGAPHITFGKSNTRDHGTKQGSKG